MQLGTMHPLRWVTIVSMLRVCDGLIMLSGLPHRMRPPSHASRVQDLRMGGPSGLPRIPMKALPLTKNFNPGGGYDLDIATLWRDLEITYGMDEDLTFRAAKRCPRLLDPQSSSRWVFFRSKDLLIKATGSEQSAIDVMSKDPSLLLCASYDGLNPKLEKMVVAAGVDPSAQANPFNANVSPALLLAGGAVLAAGTAAVAGVL